MPTLAGMAMRARVRLGESLTGAPCPSLLPRFRLEFSHPMGANDVAGCILRGELIEPNAFEQLGQFGPRDDLSIGGHSSEKTGTSSKTTVPRRFFGS